LEFSYEAKGICINSALFDHDHSHKMNHNLQMMHCSLATFNPGWYSKKVKNNNSVCILYAKHRFVKRNFWYRYL